MKKFSLKKVETNFLEAVTNRVEDPVVKERLVYLFEWYTRKAQHNKFWYNLTRFVTYLIPCLITLISVFASIIAGDGKWAIATVATLSAALVGIHHLVDHFRFYENWIRYRDTAEKLKREAELFLNRCDPYNKSKTENWKRFSTRIERITKAEISSWENLQEESYRPFKDENQAAIQQSSAGSGVNQPNPAPNALGAIPEDSPVIDLLGDDSELPSPLDAPDPEEGAPSVLDVLGPELEEPEPLAASEPQTEAK